METTEPDRLRVRPAPGEDRRSLEVLNEVARIATLGLELRPMLQRITDTLARSLGWEFVALVSIDVSRQVFVCEALSGTAQSEVHVGYSRPLGSGVVGEVAASGSAVLLDDVRLWPNYVETMPGAQSELCVPVRHHGRTVAVLNLESTQPAAFRGQRELLETVADQIAGAVASAQAHEELRRRARLMEMMSEVSRTALEATDLRALLQRITRYILERFPLELVGIVLRDPETGDLLDPTIAGNASLEEMSHWPASRGIVGRCVRHGTPQFIADVTADPEYIPVNPRVTSELVVPILFQGRVLGALNLESTSADVFTPANVLAFESFADQMAGAIHLAAVNKRLADAIDTLQRLSMIDGLTGVANRRHFDERLDVEWRRATRTRTPLSLLMLDIDWFKPFNDSIGHQEGDECLRRVAQALRDSLHRAADLVARYGGEEFAILLPETDADHARAIADAIRMRIEDLSIRHSASPFGLVTASIGVASLVPLRDATADTLVRAADTALYDAKRNGRNRVASR